MAWDSSRPVPWQRLLREWAIYVGVVAVFVAITKRNDLHVNQFTWLLLTLPIYLFIGGVLAKFGYQRKTLRDLRAESARRNAELESIKASASTTASARARSKPPPTKRTSTGPNRPTKPKRR